jgi:hypothetical protein
MMCLPTAHVAGIPIEEMLGSYGPVLLLATGVASTWLGVRIRQLRTRRRTAPQHGPSSAKGAGDGAER